MVTIEGESLNPGGSLTGGAFKNNSNLLGRRREIDELHGHVENLKKDLETMQNTLEDYRNKRNHFRDEAARNTGAASGTIYPGKYDTNEYQFHE